MALKLSKSIPLFLSAALLVFLIFPISSAAQSSKSILSGKVSDSSGGVLQGAQVTLDPGGATAVSDLQGQFLITGLNAGNTRLP